MSRERENALRVIVVVPASPIFPLPKYSDSPRSMLVRCGSAGVFWFAAELAFGKRENCAPGDA